MKRSRSRRPQRSGPVPVSIQEALREVIDHLWDDESRDFDACPPSDRSRHVFLPLKRLDGWLASVPTVQQLDDRSEV